jgi:hypothetical protein
LVDLKFAEAREEYAEKAKAEKHNDGGRESQTLRGGDGGKAEKNARA